MLILFLPAKQYETTTILLLADTVLELWLLAACEFVAKQLLEAHAFKFMSV
jgi:hypothetical protein